VAKYKLLLADDSVTIQKVVNLTFAEEGIEVITAGDGNTAMEKFVQSPPDLVMVDVNMPGFDGYKICEMIKQDDDTKHIPVILLVGSFEPFDEAEARRVGADDYLTKPFQSIRQLVSRVSDLLTRANGDNSIFTQDTLSPENHSTATSSIGDFDNAAGMKDKVNFETFDETGADDEMIQTNQIGSLPADESQKFISEPQSQTPVNNFTNWGADEDLVETRSFNPDDFEPVRTDSTKAEVSQLDDKIFQFEDEQPFTPEIKPEFSAKTTPDAKKFPEYSAISDEKNMASGANFKASAQIPDASFFDFDDLNLLEVPQIAKKPLPKVEPETVVEQIPEEPEESIVEEKKDSTETTNLSPEVIEAIAKRVIEKLSGAVVREIAHELTPQAVEAMIKETAQKKAN
jgi:DNA-binding response OmpR family regulator